MTSQPIIQPKSLPFLDEIFVNSPLCQICEFANWGIGGICSLLLNRRIPSILVVKDSQVISCNAHRNWVEQLDISEQSKKEK